MAQITVTIAGPSRDARLEWDAAKKRLAINGTTYSATFAADDGEHNYAISVWGAPAEKWTATVKGGKRIFRHSGHMSSAGSDDTGDTPYEV